MFSARDILLCKKEMQLKKIRNYCILKSANSEFYHGLLLMEHDLCGNI